MLNIKNALAVVGGALAGNIVVWSHATLGGEHYAFTFGSIIGNAIVPIILALVALHTTKPTA